VEVRYYFGSNYIVLFRYGTVCLILSFLQKLLTPLDKFWSYQDVLFDYKAGLHGIGNRSIILDVDVDVDVVKLRAQANASMPASYNSNIQLLILILISNNNSDFRFHEFRL